MNQLLSDKLMGSTKPSKRDSPDNRDKDQDEVITVKAKTTTGRKFINYSININYYTKDLKN